MLFGVLKTEVRRQGLASILSTYARFHDPLHSWNLFYLPTYLPVTLTFD